MSAHSGGQVRERVELLELTCAHDGQQTLDGALTVVASCPEHHLDLIVKDVRLTADGRVQAVMTEAGPIEGDFFIDCSGFRALLLGQTLRTPFVNFDASLFTDAALINDN